MADSSNFAAITHKQSSFAAALRLATSISVVGLRVVQDNEFRQAVRKDWEQQKASAEESIHKTEHRVAQKNAKLHASCGC